MCAAAPATGRWPSFRDAKIADIREQVGDGRVICGLSGGVDSAVAAVLIHEAIGDQLTCVFVDHGLMRAGRGRAGRLPVPQQLQHPAGPRGRERRLPRRARRASPTPRAKRKFIGSRVHRRVRGRGEEDRRRRLPRPGHALSRRDRERQLHRRPVGDDQEPPQCRRPARADEHEAGRAAARIVQGRGARARPRARPARSVRRPPSVPGPGPRHPHPRRSHAGELRHPAQGRRDLSRGDPQRRPVRRDLAGVRGAAAGAHRRRDGRLPHLRLCLRACARSPASTA